MTRTDCMYCAAHSERREALMLPVCEFPESILYLMRDQQHRGRCVLALRAHKRELYDLEPAERAAFISRAAQAARAITELFGADKINYAIFGDKVSHLHMHLVPKQAGQADWGDVFEMTSQTPTLLPPEEYEAELRALRGRLGTTEPQA